MSVSVMVTWCRIEKSTFAANLSLRLFRAIVANSNAKSLKSLHTLFDTYLDYMLAKFEPNRTVKNTQNFDKKASSLKVILTKR